MQLMLKLLAIIDDKKALDQLNLMSTCSCVIVWNLFCTGCIHSSSTSSASQPSLRALQELAALQMLRDLLAAAKAGKDVIISLVSMAKQLLFLRPAPPPPLPGWFIPVRVQQELWAAVLRQLPTVRAALVM